MAELDDETRAAFLDTLDKVYMRSKEESRAGFPHLKAILEEKANESEE